MVIQHEWDRGKRRMHKMVRSLEKRLGFCECSLAYSMASLLMWIGQKWSPDFDDVHLLYPKIDTWDCPIPTCELWIWNTRLTPQLCSIRSSSKSLSWFCWAGGLLVRFAKQLKLWCWWQAWDCNGGVWALQPRLSDWNWAVAAASHPTSQTKEAGCAIPCSEEACFSREVGQNQKATHRHWEDPCLSEDSMGSRTKWLGDQMGSSNWVFSSDEDYKWLAKDRGWPVCSSQSKICTKVGRSSSAKLGKGVGGGETVVRVKERLSCKSGVTSGWPSSSHWTEGLPVIQQMGHESQQTC